MVWKLFSFAFIIFVVVNDTNGQVSKMGTCPKGIKAKSDFKAADFNGVWYEIQRYPTTQLMGGCVSIKFSSDKKGAKITMTQLMPGMNTTLSDDSSNSFGKENGKWTYKTTLGLVTTEANFKIIDTDYKNYVAMFSCADFFNFSSLQYAWIYSRERNISQVNLNKALEAFKKQNIDVAPLVLSAQTSCS